MFAGCEIGLVKLADAAIAMAIIALGLYIVATGDTTYLAVLVVAILTAFLSTVIVARYIEEETER